IADGFAQILDVRNLAITDLHRQRVVNLRHMFRFDFVQRDVVMGLLTGQLFVGIIGRDGRGKALAFARFHTQQVFVHATEQANALTGQFKGIIFQIRNRLVFRGELQIDGDAISHLDGALNLVPVRFAVAYQLDLLLHFLRGNSGLFALKVQRAVVAEFDGGKHGNRQAKVIRLTYLQNRGVYLWLCERGDVVLFDGGAIGLVHEFVETFLIDVVFAELPL